MICVRPWAKDHPLNKIANCVSLPYHVDLLDVKGVMEIEGAEIPSGEANKNVENKGGADRVSTTSTERPAVSTD